jgi:hypothetical protein
VPLQLRRPNFVMLMLLIVFGAFSTTALRQIGWFALAGAPVLAEHLGGRITRSSRRMVLGSALCLALVLGVVLVVLHGDVKGNPIGFRKVTQIPDGLLDKMRQAQLSGRIFNAYNYGDELVYHFYPTLEVVIDSRLDAYGEAYYRRFRSLSGRQWEELGQPAELIAFLDRYDVNLIMVRDFDLRNWHVKGHTALLAEHGWQLFHRDGDNVILRRG